MEPYTHFVLLLGCAPLRTHVCVTQAAARSNIVLVSLSASMNASLSTHWTSTPAVLSRLTSRMHADARCCARRAPVTRRSLLCMFCGLQRLSCFPSNGEEHFRGCGFGNHETGSASQFPPRYPDRCAGQQPWVGLTSFISVASLLASTQNNDIPIGWLFVCGIG